MQGSLGAFLDDDCFVLMVEHGSCGMRDVGVLSLNRREFFFQSSPLPTG